MRLSEDYEIRQMSANSFTLIESYKGMDKDKKVEKVHTREYYYGTLYQALQGFLEKTSQKKDVLKEVRESVYAAISAIGTAKATIKKEFCTEVRTTK